MKERSMINGSIVKALISFLLPLLLTSILQQSYTIADGIILGNAVRQEAIGSVSNVGNLLNVFLVMQTGLAGGVSILVSHLFGAGEYKKLRSLTAGISVMLVGISAAFAAAGILFCGPILGLLHTPKAMLSLTATYFKITMCGVPFMAFYNLAASVLRGVGDSRRPLMGILVSSLINIGLDLLLVVWLDMGIAGAAVATVSAEGLSAVYLGFLLSARLEALDGGGWKFHAEPAMVWEAVRLGAPQIAQSAFTSGGKIVLQSIMNTLGVSTVVGVSIAYKVDAIIMLPLMGAASAISVFTGQNIGAKQEERARKGIKAGVILVIVFSAVAVVAVLIFGRYALRIFGASEEVVEMGYRYLYLCAGAYWLFGLNNVLSGYLEGSKDVLGSSVIACISFAVRVGCCYFFYPYAGSDILAVSEALSWAVGAFLCFLRYRRQSNYRKCL